MIFQPSKQCGITVAGLTDIDDYLIPVVKNINPNLVTEGYCQLNLDCDAIAA